MKLKVFSSSISILSRLQFAVLAFVIVGSSGQPAWADGIVTSDFVFQLNDGVFNSPEFNFTSQLQGQQSFTLPDTVIAGIAPVTVSGISGSATYQMTPASSQIVLGSPISLTSSQFTVSLTIQSVSVNSVVQTIVGGTTISSSVQGTCTNIPVQLAQGAGQIAGTILTSIDSSGLPTITVPSFQVTWGAGAWTVGSFNCMGIAGFEQQVIQGIQSYLDRNASLFNVQLQAMVAAKAASYQAQIRTTFLQPRVVSSNVSGLTVTMYPTHLQNISGYNFQLAGTLQFDFSSLKAIAPKNVTATVAAPSQLFGYALLLPAATWNALNSTAYQAGFYQYQQAGSQFTSFQSLLTSWFNEFFVWPQLMAYSSNSNFQFEFYAATQPSLSAFTDNGNGTLSQAFVGTIDVLTLAPSLSDVTTAGSIPMLTFIAPIQGSATLSLVTDSNGTPMLKALFTKLAMHKSAQLTGSWDADYVSNNQPNQYINYSLIQSNAISGLLSSGFSLSVGKLPFTQSLSLSPTSLQMQGTWIQINWN